MLDAAEVLMNLVTESTSEFLKSSEEDGGERSQIPDWRGRGNEWKQKQMQ